MRLVKHFLCSSIGKKQLVAITGLLLIGFLLSHLSGNLLMYKSAEAFDSYADFLLQQSWLLIAEVGLAGLFLAHIGMGLKVSWENRKAREEDYEVRANHGGRTVGSGSMKYTGLITLVFLLVHIYTFRLQHSGEGSLFAWVMHWFQKPLYTGFYVLAIVSLGVHLSHGVKSAFHTLGLYHPKYTPLINQTGVALAVLLGIGFGSLPLWGMLRGG
jgi:succinate dehydrogenase / fumarate reductase cytochrome b subunit